jgi:tRNA(Arg) A34 adenosine deaminase TadA
MSAPHRQTPPPAARTEPTPTQVVVMLDHAQALARRAMEAGHHPFAALLVGPDHETVLMTQGNVDSVNHAEAVLAREAARRYSPAELWPCTLVTTVEPCAMCAGTQYWANIGRTVFGIAEKALLAETGNHAENPTLDLPCRQVFARGQKDIRVVGPVADCIDAITALHRRYWRSR